jgi:HlyD family secretion protein
MELHVDVDEADVGQVKEGQQAIFTVDAFPDRKFPAAITQVRYAAQTVNGVVTYETVLKVDNRDLLLRPGMTATAEIIVEQFKHTLLVPNAALRFEMPANEIQRPDQNRGVMGMLLPFRRPARQGNRRVRAPLASKNQRSVWILKEGSPVKVPLTIGFSDGEMTAVQSGDIQAGAPLVVDIIGANK